MIGQAYLRISANATSVVILLGLRSQGRLLAMVDRNPPHDERLARPACTAKADKRVLSEIGAAVPKAERRGGTYMPKLVASLSYGVTLGMDPCAFASDRPVAPKCS